VQAPVVNNNLGHGACRHPGVITLPIRDCNTAAGAHDNSAAEGGCNSPAPPAAPATAVRRRPSPTERISCKTGGYGCAFVNHQIRNVLNGEYMPPARYKAFALNFNRQHWLQLQAAERRSGQECRDQSNARSAQIMSGSAEQMRV
jgi:hypothetical protein